MEFFKKYLSRKLLTTYVFGLVAPILFKTMGVSETVTLVSLGVGAAYLGVNTLAKKNGTE